MRRFVIALIATASTVALTQIAWAADMPVNAASTPAQVVAATWTGVYVGLNGGYAFGEDKTYDILAYINGLGWISPYPGTLPGTYNTHGGFAGGQIGANYQDGSMVFGLEADIDWSHIKGSYVDDPAHQPPSDRSSITGTVEWFGTVRGRIGIARDRFLVFATGGLAYGGVRGGVSNYYGVGSPYLTDCHTLVGWTVGGGLEYALSNQWSVKAEYLYVDLGEKEFVLSDPSNYSGYTNAGVGYAVSKANSSVYFNVVRLGINYKF